MLYLNKVRKDTNPSPCLDAIVSINNVQLLLFRALFLKVFSPLCFTISVIFNPYINKIRWNCVCLFTIL